MISAELYKLVNGIDDIEKYRNTFLNLAIPAFSFSEPIAPATVRISTISCIFFSLFVLFSDDVFER